MKIFKVGFYITFINMEKNKQLIDFFYYWLEYKLRDRPYVNLSFCRVSDKNEYNNNEEDKEIADLIKHCFGNSKRIIDEMTNDDDQIHYFGVLDGENDVEQINEYLGGHKDNEYLMQNIEVINDEMKISNESFSKTLLHGKCNKQQALNILNGIIANDFLVGDSEDKKPLILLRSCFYFEKKNVIFYPYDHRGGIIYSLDDDKNYLGKLYVKYFDIINLYWCSNMYYDLDIMKNKNLVLLTDKINDKISLVPS